MRVRAPSQIGDLGVLHQDGVQAEIIQVPDPDNLRAGLVLGRRIVRIETYSYDGDAFSWQGAHFLRLLLLQAEDGELERPSHRLVEGT